MFSWWGEKVAGAFWFMAFCTVCHGMFALHLENVILTSLVGYVWLWLFLDILSSLLTLKLPITTIVVSLPFACHFKSCVCKQCGPTSDCSSRSSLIRAHAVCLYAKIGLKSLQEYSADDISRWHFQMQVFLAFYNVRDKVKCLVDSSASLFEVILFQFKEVLFHSYYHHL